MAYLVDSSVWIALYVDDDSLHTKAVHLAETLSGTIYVPYVVVSEVATVVAQKHSKEQAESFFKFLEESSEVVLLDPDTAIDIEFFRKLPAKISFADATLLRLAPLLKAKLVTYDRQLERLARKGAKA